MLFCNASSAASKQRAVWGIKQGSLSLSERRLRSHEEETFHRRVVENRNWLVPSTAFFYHCPMGGKRHSRAAGPGS
jgi:hypothetical protein